MSKNRTALHLTALETEQLLNMLRNGYGDGDYLEWLRDASGRRYGVNLAALNRGWCKLDKHLNQQH